MTEFRDDVIAGLSGTPKTLPSKYLYDEEGSRLFEAITRTPEYYPTRVETALLTEIAPELMAHLPPGAALIEFGSGSSLKTRLLLDAAPQLGLYAPIDISPDALAEAATMLRAAYPRLEIAPVVGDFTTAINLPAAAQGRARIGFFPGSTLGNFDADGAARFMRSARERLGDGSQFLVGYDLVKDEATLLAAYDDAEGVTAAFNLNLLNRIDRELGGTFDLSAFGHKAIWNARERRMEMHLVSVADQNADVCGHRFSFAAGETIHTENSYKFTVDTFGEIAGRGGWRVDRTWISATPVFAVSRLVAV